MLAIFATIISVATTITKALAVVGMAIEGLKVIGKAIIGIGKALGLIKPETQVEDLGEKALQSGLKPEDFKSYDEYFKAVENFDLKSVPPEQRKNFTPEEKTAKGIELSTGILLEKVPQLPIAEFANYLSNNPDWLKNNSKLVAGIFDLAKTSATDFSLAVKYMNGTEKNVEKKDAAIDILAGVQKSVNPSLSESEAIKAATLMRK